MIGGTKGRLLALVGTGDSTQDRLDAADLLGFNDRWEGKCEEGEEEEEVEEVVVEEKR